MTRRAIWGLSGMLVMLGAGKVWAGELEVAHVAAQAGQSVSVPVSYQQGGGTAATALMTDINFDPAALSNPRCAAGAALTSGSADKMVQCAEASPGVLRVILFGLNQNPIPDGEVATVTFDVSATARPRRYALRNLPSASDAAGHDFRLSRKSGAVKVGG